MEQIETQASDLRFLAQAQVPLSNSPSVTYETPRPPHQQGSPGSATFGGNSATPGAGAGGDPNGGGHASSSNKRKSADDGGASAKQTRSKRNRYISIACNECKRRKIKCNGETPCKRCGNMDLACLYTTNCCASTFKDSDEYKIFSNQLNTLHDEVAALKQAMQAMQSGQPDRPHMMPSMERAPVPPGMIAPSPAQSSVSGRPASIGQAKTPGNYRGSTSTTHMLGLTQHNTGITYAEAEGTAPPPAESQIHPTSPAMDPILGYNKEEMVRLCQLHDDEIGVMYPVLNMGEVTEHARKLAAQFDSLHYPAPNQLINDDKTLELKMVMCCAHVVEAHGPSAKAQRLFDSMESTLNRKLLADEAYLSILPLLCLFAGYRFLTDDEGLAWRVIGQVCRLCLELGLHRSEVHGTILDDSERRNALNCFWSAYVLDRRWAFNTGLPYVIQDADIDPQLPFPNDHRYLVSMISYSKLAAKIWNLVEQRKSAFLNYDNSWIQDIEKLDNEISEWYSHVPPEVQIRDWHEEGQVNSTSSYNLQRLRVWTYLRKNQIRNWLYAPVLHSTSSMMGVPRFAQMCVDVAKDTVAYLSHVNSHTDMVRKSRAFYSQFLSSSLAIMLLASTQAPVQFASTCREDFYTGLSLIEDLSPRSHISKRLWRVVWSLRKYLEQVAPKQDNDAHSNAALGMIGLARGDPASAQNPYGGPFLPIGPDVSGGVMVEGNGQRLQEELIQVFEQMANFDSFRGIPGQGQINALPPGDGGRNNAQDIFYSHIVPML